MTMRGPVQQRFGCVLGGGPTLVRCADLRVIDHPGAADMGLRLALGGPQSPSLLPRWRADASAA